MCPRVNQTSGQISGLTDKYLDEAERQTKQGTSFLASPRQLFHRYGTVCAITDQPY